MPYTPALAAGKYAAYYKDVQHVTHVDIYEILRLFGVTDPCVAHAAKKLLLSGVRNGGKDAAADINEALDSLTRWKEMQ